MSYYLSSDWDTYEDQAMYDWIESILDYIDSKVYPYFIASTLKQFRSKGYSTKYLEWDSLNYSEDNNGEYTISFQYLKNNYYVDIKVDIPTINNQPSVLIAIIRILNSVLDTDFSIERIGNHWSICYYNPVQRSYDVIPSDNNLQIYNDFESVSEAGNVLAIATN